MTTKTLTQIFISILVLALGLWALYENKQTTVKKKISEASFLNQVKLENIKAFHIIKDDTQLSIVREDTKWLLQQPVQDLASFTEISRWLGELKNIKVQKISKKEGSNWKEYYLDSAPQVKIELTSDKTVSFSVSKKSSFDGKYFIKVGQELFIGESYFYSEVNVKDFDSFRNKRLLPLQGHATKIQFQGKQNFTLKWQDYKWSFQLISAKSFPLDSDRLDGFWTDITSMQAVAIKESKQASSLKKYGLHKPQLIIQLHYPNEDKKYVLKLSPFKGEKAFVAMSHTDFIFEISKEEAKKMLLSKNDIRDHAFPFNYDTLKAVQIEQKSKKNSFAIKKLNQTWQSLSKKELTVDSKKVEDLLDKIKNLKAKKYQFDSTTLNLRSIEIKDSKGQQIFELKEISQSEIYSWLKTNLWDELVAVPKDSLNAIFNMNIFISQDQKATKNKPKNIPANPN